MSYFQALIILVSNAQKYQHFPLNVLWPTCSIKKDEILKQFADLSEACVFSPKLADEFPHSLCKKNVKKVLYIQGVPEKKLRYLFLHYTPKNYPIWEFFWTNHMPIVSSFY